ncbi:tetratricopeptide repeat protein [Micromonospora sp. NPDC007230]|uniref:tetratricopeptide repeat protein n=1 Tax=Micromonospora sp. NPDC007230 TaxID=3364237 RepID=UPI0036CE0F33
MDVSGDISPVAAFCADLRRCWQASGRNLPSVAREIRISRTQLYAILNGEIKRPPDFDTLVRPLIRACGGTDTDVADWRRRHEVLVGVHTQLHRHPVARVPVPAQLPADIKGFAGRTAALAALDAATAPVVTVTGTAGVGKTSLVVHWAHRVAERFDGGQLYVDLGGFGPPGTAIEPGTALQGFLQALGVPADHVPQGVVAQAALYRSLLARRRVLVVLDNARDVDQVRLLLPGAPGCVTLITSRDQLAGLLVVAAAHPLGLGPLSEPDAQALLRTRLGARCEAAPGAVRDIVSACAGLPLALAIAAARAACRQQLSLAHLAAELDTAAPLDALDAGYPGANVRVVFSWSYRLLQPVHARLFRLLAAHPGPDVAVPDAASLAGMPVPEAREALANLACRHLVSEHAPGRYVQHDLLRSYAEELLNTNPPEHRRAAERRLLDYYVQTARAAALLLEPDRELPPSAPAQPGALPVSLSTAEAAGAWLDANRAVLLRAVRYAYQVRQDMSACLLAAALATYLQRNGYWPDQLRLSETALAAAARLGDPAFRALSHRGLSRALVRLRRYDEAEAHLRRSLEIDRRAGDLIGQARALNTLGLVAQSRHRHTEARRHTVASLAMFESAGHRGGMALTLSDLGWIYALRGQYRQALDCCERALAIFEKLDDEHGRACCWDSLGYIYTQLGNHAYAAGCFRRSEFLFRWNGERYLAAQTLVNAGANALAHDDAHEAIRSWRVALQIFDELGAPDAERVGQLLAENIGPMPKSI